MGLFGGMVRLAVADGAGAVAGADTNAAAIAEVMKVGAGGRGSPNSPSSSESRMMTSMFGLEAIWGGKGGGPGGSSGGRPGGMSV